MKRTPLFLSVCVLASSAAPCFSQESSQYAPPNVITIVREEVKWGRSAAHERTEVGWPRAYGKAKIAPPFGYIAMVSDTGPPEAWYMNAWGSYAEWEKSNKWTASQPALQAELDALSAADADHLRGLRVIHARYRRELSHNANVDIATMRYFQVITFRVRPGREADFEAATKIYQDAVRKAGVPFRWATFEVQSGMLGPTYLIFIPMKSAAELDSTEEQDRQFQASFGENWNQLMKHSTDGFITTETNVFSFAPKQSFVSKEWAAGDPEFWHPKPKPAKAPAKTP